MGGSPGAFLSVPFYTSESYLAFGPSCVCNKPEVGVAGVSYQRGSCWKGDSQRGTPRSACVETAGVENADLLSPRHNRTYTSPLPYTPPGTYMSLPWLAPAPIGVPKVPQARTGVWHLVVASHTHGILTPRCPCPTDATDAKTASVRFIPPHLYISGPKTPRGNILRRSVGQNSPGWGVARRRRRRTKFRGNWRETGKWGK